jgi:hypothetical protein
VRKRQNGSTSYYNRHALDEQQRRRHLLSIRWQDGDAHTPTELDLEFMASWGCYAVKYFDVVGTTWWGFFQLGNQFYQLKVL